MDRNELLFRGALTLALGLIIGFQRERKESALAGIRTFPLFAFTGFFCALLESSGTLWTVAAGLLALGALLTKGMLTLNDHKPNGITTEMAALFVFLMGAALVKLPHVELVVVAGGICALLLHMKDRMHGLVDKMNRGEVHAIMQFVLIAFVILPLLPDRTFDSYGVLNPRKIWLMVVLITGISLVSFSVQKIKNDHTGTLWTGILGGLISSTATTVTLSRISAKHPMLRSIRPAIVIASTVAFIRVISEILIVSPTTFRSTLPPVSLLFGFMILLCAISLFRSKEEAGPGPGPREEAPAELKAAIIFGIMFAAILYLSAWARATFGDEGLYAVSFISGLIDVDAVTLSTAQLIEQGAISTDLGWRLIIVAFISNLVFKASLVLAIAKGAVRRQVVLDFSIATLVGGAIAYFG